MSIEHKIVFVRIETVLVQVKMAEVLSGKRFDGKNRTRSVILESMVVKEKLCIHPWTSIF